MTLFLGDGLVLEEAPGRGPGPRQGLCHWTPAKAHLCNPIIGVGVRGGLRGGCNVTVGPLSPPPQSRGSKGEPLSGSRGGALVGSGAKPRRLRTHRPLPQ